MSRSFRKQPFCSVTGNLSAKDDKRLAHRGVRRKQDLVVAVATKAGDWDDFLIPHKRECSWNNVCSWSRDGNQRWRFPSAYAWSLYVEAQQPDARSYMRHYYSEWPPKWYTKMMRK